MVCSAYNREKQHLSKPKNQARNIHIMHVLKEAFQSLQSGAAIAGDEHAHRSKWGRWAVEGRESPVWLWSCLFTHSPRADGFRVLRAVGCGHPNSNKGKPDMVASTYNPRLRRRR